MGIFKKIFSFNNESTQKPKAVNQLVKEIDNQKNSPNLTSDEKELLIHKLAKNEISIYDSKANTLDPLLKEAARAIVINKNASIGFLQTNMKVGYNQCGRLLDQLESFGIVGPNLGSTSREILFKELEDLDNYLKNNIGDVKIDLQEFYNTHKNEIETLRTEYQKTEIENIRKKERESIKQYLLEKERLRQLNKEIQQELISEGKIKTKDENQELRREQIPKDLMDRVWNRDNGKCVECGSKENLEFDHIIPFSKGGATTYRNLQILCKSCNLEKSNKIG